MTTRADLERFFAACDTSVDVSNRILSRAQVALARSAERGESGIQDHELEWVLGSREMMLSLKEMMEYTAPDPSHS